MIHIKLSKRSASKAAEILKAGGIVIFPTDTVYGLLADAGNKKAVGKIYKIKKRAKSKPLPVFVKNLSMAKGLAEINSAQEKIINKKWPGKFTFVLSRKDGYKLFGVERKTVAVRVPKYPFLDSLLNKMARPLAQTSANISSNPPITKRSDILKDFGELKNGPDMFVDAGNLKKAKPSAIIDLTKGNIKILRK